MLTSHHSPRRGVVACALCLAVAVVCAPSRCVRVAVVLMGLRVVVYFTVKDCLYKRWRRIRGYKLMPDSTYPVQKRRLPEAVSTTKLCCNTRSIHSWCGRRFPHFLIVCPAPPLFRFMNSPLCLRVVSQCCFVFRPVIHFRVGLLYTGLFSPYFPSLLSRGRSGNE